MQLWRNRCLISGGMWVLCSPRRTSLRLGACCWPIRCQLLPVLVPSPHVRSLCQPRTLVWGPRRPLFFQALGITTKISRGTIEILSDVQLIKTGDKVGASEATLLNMLNISPFSFGLIIQQVFDNGSIYNPEVLDITEQALHSHFLEGVRNVASVCLQMVYPTVASVPHSIINGYKRVLALSVETEYTFPLAKKVKAFLADPSAFVAAATTAAPAAAAAAAPAKTEAKEESEESDEDMGFGLFN
ncbi:60S acidic ribosomal protein P0 [Lemmus lemmus]